MDDPIVAYFNSPVQPVPGGIVPELSQHKVTNNRHKLKEFTTHHQLQYVGKMGNQYLYQTVTGHYIQSGLSPDRSTFVAIP